MIDDYDLNVHSNLPNLLALTAYRQGFNNLGEVVSDYTPETTFTLLMSYPENSREIAWLLLMTEKALDIAMKEWDNGLTDYDEWPTFDEVLVPNCPPKILEWLNGLPAYERRTLV